jgi:hypothetical protein
MQAVVEVVGLQDERFGCVARPRVWLRKRLGSAMMEHG